jgi:hypothetical protein
MRRMTGLDDLTGPASAGALENQCDFLLLLLELVSDEQGVEKPSQRLIGAGFWI